MKKLDEIPKKNPFKVPDNYFDELNSRIISAAEANKPVVMKVVHKRPFRLLAAAASIAGLMLLSYAGYRLLSASRDNNRLSEALNSDNIELIMNDLDLGLIEQNAYPADPQINTTDVSSSEIVNYLLRENIDVSEIYERL
jgi:hypothetical protein